jgi:hypothetical protein
MRVRDLRDALEGIRSMFEAARSTAQETAQERVLAEVASSLQPHDSSQLHSYLRDLSSNAAEATEPLVDRFTRQLHLAELDEEKFKMVLQEMQEKRRAKKLKKADAQVIAEAYTGSFDRRATTEKLIDDIKLSFYEKLYKRDSGILASRANPI